MRGTTNTGYRYRCLCNILMSAWPRFSHDDHRTTRDLRLFVICCLLIVINSCVGRVVFYGRMSRMTRQKCHNGQPSTAVWRRVTRQSSSIHSLTLWLSVSRRLSIQLQNNYTRRFSRFSCFTCNGRTHFTSLQSYNLSMFAVEGRTPAQCRCRLSCLRQCQNNTTPHRTFNLTLYLYRINTQQRNTPGWW